MKIAYASDWLSSLFTSNASLQRGCAAEWMSVATLSTLIASNAHLAALADLPAIQVAVMTLGTVTFIVIRLGVAELTVQPIDRRADLSSPTSQPSTTQRSPDCWSPASPSEEKRSQKA